MRTRRRFLSGQSKKFVERKQIRLAVTVFMAVTIVAGSIYGVSSLSHMKTFEIRSVQVFGADENIRTSLEAAASKAVEGNYAGLISRTNKYLYPKSSVKTAVLNATPSVDSVEAEISGGSLVVRVSEKTPAAVVCASLPDFSSEPESCYFADPQGRIFKEAPLFSPGVFKKYFIPAISGKVSTNEIIGSLAASTTEFTSLQSFYGQVSDAGLAIEAVLVKVGGEYELYVRNPSIMERSDAEPDSHLVVIYFNDSRLFEEQAINLVSFWKNMTDNARAKREKLVFESIDVRYGSNVFYRLIR